MDWQFENGRIFCEEDCEVLAEVTYDFRENGQVDINHTYISPKLRGHGAGEEMMKIAAQYLRKNGYILTASCPYAGAWLEKNKH